MKTCIICEQTLPLDDFYIKSEKSKQGKEYHYSYCKKCFNKHTSDSYRNKKLKAIEYKGGKCQYCGYNKSYYALEFHHLNPLEKDAIWNIMRRWKWEKIQEELDKCMLLCANCHREEHERQNTDNIENL